MPKESRCGLSVANNSAKPSICTEVYKMTEVMSFLWMSNENFLNDPSESFLVVLWFSWIY